MIPVVEDLESAELVHRFGDVFNPPALTNFRGSVQAAVDITGIRSLNFPPFGCSDLYPPITWSDSLTGALFLDGRYFGAAGAPIAFEWRPDRIQRRAEIDGLRLQSDTVLVVDEMACVIRLRIENFSGQARRLALRFGLKSTVTRNAAGWKQAFSPSELDNEVVIDDARRALLFRARHSAAVSLQGVFPRAEEVDPKGVVLRPAVGRGETVEVFLVDVIAETVDQARALYDRIGANPAAELVRARECWDEELRCVFTPGNGRYSGSLPRLETRNRHVERLYHAGVAGVVYFKRESAQLGRTYTTLMPRYWQTITWLWDYQLASTVHAMLDPAVMRRLLELWMSKDIHAFMGTDWLTREGVGEPYAINDHAILQLLNDYVRWTGDRAWLEHTVTDEEGGRWRIIDRVRAYARAWEQRKSASGLADYGGLKNLLECVSSYAHEVAGLNVANVANLRIAADLLALVGQEGDAAQLRGEAAALLAHVQELYVEGGGYWYARHPGGRKVPVRHCFDLLTVLNAIPNDLTEQQRLEMRRFFREELQTPAWMYALSPRDADCVFDLRPDHQWTGSYVAWPARTAAGLLAIGEVELVADWIKGLARTTRQGPFGQAHFVEWIMPPEAGGARKAPSEFPFLVDWACAGGGAWASLVIESMFGLTAPPGDHLQARPVAALLGDDARLVNVPHHGRLYTVDRRGVHLQDGPA